MAELPGLHHVTAICGDPQANLDFYAGVLGLRLVKRTVNFDDPGSYHLYYGDDAGRPGTLLTFFAWPGARRGRAGAGQASAHAFSVPRGSLPRWRSRLERAGVTPSATGSRFGEESLGFADPDGMRVELVAAEPESDAPGIVRVHSVTLLVADAQPSAALLTETLGARAMGAEGTRYRFELAAGGPGTIVDLVHSPAAGPGLMAAGAIHHVAFRAQDDAAQLEWREQLTRQGARVSPVMDRDYFRSIYFREPGGVLYEIATDAPGFAVDEEPGRLGEALRLPAWLGAERAAIEAALPPITVPKREAAWD